MKNTNIDWCTQIPSEWTEVRIKDIALLKSGYTFNPDYLMDGEKYPVYGGNGLRGYTNLFNNVGEHVLIGRQGALCGNINYADGKFFATEHAIVVYPYKIQETIHWLGETLRSANYNRLSMTAAQPGLAVSVLSNQVIPYPSYNERVAIANYLDSKCSKIDASIAALSEMKDKYFSLKKSLINETVCRGLNKSVSLKSSGIDSIGDIPEHWEVKRIKDLVSINSKVLSDSTNKNYTFKYIDISSVSSDGNISISEEYSFSEAPSRARRIIKRNDIIVSTVRTYLQAIAQIDWNANDAIVSTGFAVLSPNKKVCSPSYLFYAIKSEVTINEIMRLSIGVSYPAITAYYLCNIPLAIPPLSEQQSIATYLDTQCSKIDSIIENIVSQIEAYTKLKKSLINEVVTGKKRVI